MGVGKSICFWGCDERGKVKCKHIIFCLQRSAHSQFIPSFCGEKHGSSNKRQ